MKIMGYYNGPVSELRKKLTMVRFEPVSGGGPAHDSEIMGIVTNPEENAHKLACAPVIARQQVGLLDFCKAESGVDRDQRIEAGEPEGRRVQLLQPIDDGGGDPLPLPGGCDGDGSQLSAAVPMRFHLPAADEHAVRQHGYLETGPVQTERIDTSLADKPADGSLVVRHGRANKERRGAVHPAGRVK